MNVNRRAVLKGAGIAVLVAGGALGWRVWDQRVLRPGTGPAYQPWKDWDSAERTGPLRFVAAAILAANPHNSQPWVFRVTASHIELFADKSRRIGTIDPYLREMHIGLGCALENLVLAANADGFRTRVELMPKRNDRDLIARVAFKQEGAERSELYHAIPSRHTNRGVYDRARAVPASLLKLLSDSGGTLPEVRIMWFDEPERREKLGQLIIEGTEAIIADKQQSQDSGKWIRENWQAIQTHRDGITLDALNLPPLINAVAKILPPPDLETADRVWLEATRDRHVASAPAFGMLVARDARAWRQCVIGGRVWQRLHLKATLEGLALHPLNQPSERADRELQLRMKPKFGTALRALVATEKWQPLMPFRIGYPTSSALPSPRRGVESVVV